MSRFEAWLGHVATILVGGTGLLYAWMRYLMEPVDPYAVVNHPLQPGVQHLHILTAPLLVFVAGQIWHRHAWAHWKRGVRQRRASGVSLGLTAVPMIVSGYLIQTTITEGWRTAWIVIHCATSGLWVAGYLAHQIAPLLRNARKAGRAGRAEAEVAAD